MNDDAMGTVYDDAAEASGWYGPEVVFGLSYKFVRPGQTVLDIGIGTGLGSVLFRKAGLIIHGMDNSPQMLDACREKGFSSLQEHDLSEAPYPYDAESMDHVVCVGVLNFFSDPGLVFREASRVLRAGGLFIFVVCDREGGEDHEITVEAEHAGSDKAVTMYRHGADQIDAWMNESGFELARSLGFTMFMDQERIMSMPAKAYLAIKP